MSDELVRIPPIETLSVADNHKGSIIVDFDTLRRCFERLYYYASFYSKCMSCTIPVELQQWKNKHSINPESVSGGIVNLQFDAIMEDGVKVWTYSGRIKL